MERYSKILDKDKREIVLLIGNGCKWSKCKFCNYHLDRNNIEEEQYQINLKALESVTGEFGVLEAINSGSIFELNERSFNKLLEVCKEKKIKRLIIESHYMYKSRIADFRKSGVIKTFQKMKENIHDLIVKIKTCYCGNKK